MRKCMILITLAFCIVGALSMTFISAPLKAAQKMRASRQERIRKEATKFFEEGEKKYSAGSYHEAYFCFHRVRRVNPAYKTKQVEAYLKLIEYKLGKTPRSIEKFEPKKIPEREVKVEKEEEWQILVAQAEEAILSAGRLLDKVRKTKKLPEKDLLDARLNFSDAEKAFERKQYREAKRLADKCRYEIEILLSRKEPPKELLGEIGDTLVTLNLNNADLQETLKLIYDLTHANIVLSPGISGRVTINVRDLPLRDVLDVIVESNNLKYIEKKRIIRILSQAEYEKSEEGLAKINRKAFRLHYGEAIAIAKVIKDTLKIESVTADPRTNSIIAAVSSTAEADRIESLIRSLDAPMSQVLIDIKLIEVTFSKGKTGTPNTLGINWTMANRLIDIIDPPTTLIGPAFASAIKPSDIFTFALSNKKVNALISALAQQGEVHMLSQPRILTLDGRQAVMQIVEELPFVTGVTSSTTTTAGVSTTTYSYTIETRTDIGITLTVIPRIQRNRSVHIHLELAQIRIIDFLTLDLGGEAGTSTSTPHLADRISSQDVVVWDGQTLVLGGMIGTKKGKEMIKVPFLGNIPLIGHLFKRTEVYDERSELVIFLTPYIITSFEEGEKIRKEKEWIEKQPDLGIMEKF